MRRGRRSASCGIWRRRPDAAGAARPAVTTSRTVMIAGAGIGGLTAALALARTGLRVAIYEQAGRLEEAGAGIQLSPNASRVLLDLGLGELLRPHLVTPEGLVVRSVPSGRVLARAPLGTAIALRYGAPYWVIHRADLQAALLEAALAHPDIRLHLGVRVEDFAPYRDGVTIAGLAGGRSTEARGAALVVADGLWSRLRRRLGDNTPPRFADHIAWRALAPAENLAADLSGPIVNLWLGPSAHLVHYPVKGGRLINIVAIVRDKWAEQGWNTPADRRDVLQRFAPRILAARHPNPAGRRHAMAEVGALRSPSPASLGEWCRHGARRRRAPHAAIPRAGRRDGDRRRGRAGPMRRRDAGRSSTRHAQL